MKVQIALAVVALSAPILSLSGCGQESAGTVVSDPGDLEKLEAMQKADEERAKSSSTPGEV